MANIVTSAGGGPVAITIDSVGQMIAGAVISSPGWHDWCSDTDSFLPVKRPGSYPDRVSDIRNRLLEVSRLAGWAAVKVPAETTGAGQYQSGQRIHPTPDEFNRGWPTAVNATA